MQDAADLIGNALYAVENKQPCVLSLTYINYKHKIDLLRYYRLPYHYDNTPAYLRFFI